MDPPSRTSRHSTTAARGRSRRSGSRTVESVARGRARLSILPAPYLDPFAPGAAGLRLGGRRGLERPRRHLSKRLAALCGPKGVRRLAAEWPFTKIIFATGARSCDPRDHRADHPGHLHRVCATRRRALARGAARARRAHAGLPAAAHADRDHPGPRAGGDDHRRDLGDDPGRHALPRAQASSASCSASGS